MACIAAAFAVVAKRLVVTEELEEDYPPERHPEAEADVAEIVRESGSSFTRKRLLLGAGAATGGAVGLAAVTPLLSIGPVLGHRSARSDAVAARHATGRQVWAPLPRAGHRTGNVLYRLPRARRSGADRGAGRRGAPRPGRAAPAGGPGGWAPQGILAYSKICTHAGCAIALYRKPTFAAVEPGPALVCPCHYSTFDPATGGAVIYGPAGRALPQLPVAVDAAGQLRAAGNFSGPVGPVVVGGQVGEGDVISESVRFVDERVGAARGVRKILRYVFPDHWSFLLGEVALYAFMVLVATGIYLTLFFDPSLAKVTYHGAYAPLAARR